LTCVYHPHGYPTQFCLRRPVLLAEIPNAHHPALAHRQAKGG
jgi:hypothetical protein